jgi:predicted RNA-binding Zn-ribbon protein involved in translation (DUF1610 family)
MECKNCNRDMVDMGTYWICPHCGQTEYPQESGE